MAWRTSIAGALLSLITLSLCMIWLAVRDYPALWSQPGARGFVSGPVLAFFAYVVAILWISTRRSSWWMAAMSIAIPIGVLAGCVEIGGIVVENNLLFVVHGPAIQIGGMATLFSLWAFAGWRAARRLHSRVAGATAAIVSAGVCMVLGVTAGFLVEFFVAAPSPAAIAYWAEFQRSGWTDARAFGLANTLDSGFTHLLIAPIVGAVLGGLAALIGNAVGEKAPG